MEQVLEHPKVSTPSHVHLRATKVTVLRTTPDQPQLLHRKGRIAKACQPAYLQIPGHY